MLVKQDPITKLWCREDGAICAPPNPGNKKFHWAYGHNGAGYKVVMIRHKKVQISPIMCRAFHGTQPKGTVCIHKDGASGNNAAANLAWGAPGCRPVDVADLKYGIRTKDKAAYARAMRAAVMADPEKAEALRRRGREYMANHKDKGAAWHAKWQKDNKTYWNEYQAKYRAKQKAKGLVFRKDPETGKYKWIPKEGTV